MAFVPAQCLKLNARHITLASLLDNEGAVNIEEFVEAVVISAELMLKKKREAQ
jgi:hypothetical protein